MKFHCQTFRGDDGTLEVYEDIISRAQRYPSEIKIDKEESCFTKEGDYTIVLRWWTREDQSEDGSSTDLTSIVSKRGM